MAEPIEQVASILAHYDISDDDWEQLRPLIRENETLETRMQSCLADLRQILASQTENRRINADMMLAEQAMTKALTHVEIYVAGVAL